MDNKKKKFNTNRVAAYALSGVMLASVIPYNVFANTGETQKAISDLTLDVGPKNITTPVSAGQTDATSGATY